MIVRAGDGGCTVTVRVHPGAICNAISGTHGDALKISLTAPPTDGRANAALIEFLAQRLGVPRLSVELIAGSASRTKVVRILGVTATEVEAQLLSDLA
jgi:uncharacterized protein (TIGR00251 family)